MGSLLVELPGKLFSGDPPECVSSSVAQLESLASTSETMTGALLCLIGHGAVWHGASGKGPIPILPLFVIHILFSWISS